MDMVALPTPAELNARKPGTLLGMMGMETIEVERGRVVLRMTVRPDLLAPNGYLHGGTIVALADSACGMASFAHMPVGAEGFTTVELKTNFLGTTTEGELRCIATPQHLGKSTQVWDAEVIRADTDKTIAIFRCSQMILWPK
jgi:1,4-dihydroxy-2-naphthoyl-CoA hydrolase